jgi:hypothetical protein
MHTRIGLALAALLVAAAALTSQHVAPAAHAAATPAPGQDSSTLDDQVDLAVTVYNSDIALVRDVRDLVLARGNADLRFMDIAATVNPATVHFRSLTEPSRLNVIEQNYEYDLLERQAAAQMRQPRRHLVRRRSEAARRARSESPSAQLRHRPVWRIGGEIVTGLTPITSSSPAARQPLHPSDSIWTLDNAGAAHRRVEASYLAASCWSADYVLTVRATQGRGSRRVGDAERQRHVVPEHQLQLVAGDLNRVRNVLARAGIRARRRPAARPVMAQESFSTTPLPLGRKTTINNDGVKQVSMLAGTGIPVHKRYVVEGRSFITAGQHPGRRSRSRSRSSTNSERGARRAGDADAVGRRACVR